MRDLPGTTAAPLRDALDTTGPLLAAFRHAASAVPAYRRLLQDHGVEPAAIVDRETFTARCPVLSKADTFVRFPIAQLCAGGTTEDLAEVLTSSAHGGRFAFGLVSRRRRSEVAVMIDEALDAAFEVARRRTLAINCLPMGVGFSSNCMTVATTSVREDMAAALVRAFGSQYDQVLIVSDPLFLKRLLDYAREQGVDWRQYRVGVVLGEEIFGELFRSYVAGRLGLDIARGDGGYIMSSFGVGELGLHLCHETRATIALRRAAVRRPALAHDLFGVSTDVPMMLTFNPHRTLMEALDPDPDEYGRLTVSMLDTSLPVPLLRYQTGDVVRLLDSAHVAALVRRHQVTLPEPLPGTLLALRGRAADVLPDGSCVAGYKDALYADPLVADRLTGAFRLTATDAGVTAHVQLVGGVRPEATFEDRLRAALRLGGPVAQVIVSPYEEFPYGMGLDYERKFAYYVPGAPPSGLA